MNNSEKQTLWIVTELFYPDETSTSYILSKIADKMMEKYNVNVITTNNLYQKRSESKPFYTIDENINITRITSTGLDKNNLMQRLFRMAGLTNLLYAELKKKIRENDKLLITTNPAPLLLKCGRLKNKMNIDFTILVHDVFPENTIPAGIISSQKSLFFKYLSGLFNKAYSKANKLIVLGRDMHDIVSKKMNKKNKTQIVIIENWGDIDNIKPTENKDSNLQIRHSEGKITIQYAGNIGRVQGLDVFINLLKESDNKNICFDLYGDGAIKDRLQEFVINNTLESQVHFHKSYSRDEQNRILNNCDIALVTLANGMYGLGVPSKTYNIMAAGKPILFIGDTKSEIGRMIIEESLGYVFEATDHEKIIDFLRNLSTSHIQELSNIGRKSRFLVETKYSENIILEKILHEI